MDRKYLEELLALPTAPFCEQWVARSVLNRLRSHSVPHFLDPVGNIVVGVNSEAAYRRRLDSPSPEPVRVFMAHMDHPGFHGVKWGAKGRLIAKWHGGGTPLKFLPGARVFLADRNQWTGHGAIVKVKLAKSKRALETLEIKCDEGALSKQFPNAADLFGGFAFKKPVWSKNRILYTKAADDLVGVFSLVSLALKMNTSGINEGAEDFIIVLTRGEEVGFVGAIGHVELGWLQKAKRPVFFVSLETSRTFPGAEVGAGPVVRLGDRATVFTPGAIQVMDTLAKEILPGKYQKRIMDGGTCEATVGIAYNFTSMGISIPLGNYHNQSYQGGPEARGKLGPAPEFVGLDDIEGMITLCEALLRPKLSWKEPWAARQKSMREGAESFRNLIANFKP